MGREVKVLTADETLLVGGLETRLLLCTERLLLPITPLRPDIRPLILD
jgi:hypothetical protein